MEHTFDPFALAIWIMDDGAADGKQLRINSQCFSLEENLWLIKFLHAKFGIEVRLNMDKGKYRLRVKSSSMFLLKELSLFYSKYTLQIIPVTTDSRLNRDEIAQSAGLRNKKFTSYHTLLS